MSNRRPLAVAVAGMSLTASMTLAAVASFEGVSHKVYLDVGGVPTWCYGATGPEVEYREYTQAECEALLAGDLLLHTTIMMRSIKVPLTQGEMVAYSSFTYNVGVNAFAKSTLVRMLNAGNRIGACKQLLLWIKVKGKVVRGLVNRRNAEYKLCMTLDLDKAVA